MKFVDGSLLYMPFRPLLSLFLTSGFFISSSRAEELPTPFTSHLETKTPTLPASQAGYYYSASHDPVAYAADAVTMIQIKPVNLELLPTLILDLPDGLTLLGAIRAIDIGREARQYLSKWRKLSTLSHQAALQEFVKIRSLLEKHFKAGHQINRLLSRPMGRRSAA